MKDIYQLVNEHESNLEDFLNWQIESGPTNNFREFAEFNATAQDAFKYAAILYPKFILVEENVVLADHYEEKNWASWRETLDPKDTANLINHLHVDNYLTNDSQGAHKLEQGLGDLLAFFWLLAVNHQFPGKNVLVEYDGDVVNVTNQ